MGEINHHLRSPAAISAVAVMVFVYYTTVFVFLDRWLNLVSSNGILNAAAFTWIALTCAASFFAAAFTDPGRVPQFFAPEVESAGNDAAHTRFCDKCQIYKPPRTHHCRSCKRCVLKMDHHCVWIDNCVGYANYKAFFVCVFNAAVGSIYSLVIFTSSVIQAEHDFRNNSAKIYYVLCGSLFAILCVLTTTLLGWHIYLLTHNLTTIEFREGVRAKWLAKKRGQLYHHPFDIGVYENVVSVLGPNALKWFCPIAVGHLKDGTEFPITASGG